MIADVQMPGMSGVKLQAHLRTKGYRVPFIFVRTFRRHAGRCGYGCSERAGADFAVGRTLDRSDDDQRHRLHHGPPGNIACARRIAKARERARYTGMAIAGFVAGWCRMRTRLRPAFSGRANRPAAYHGWHFSKEPSHGSQLIDQSLRRRTVARQASRLHEQKASAVLT
jgi:hypothetical protein